MSKHPGTMKKHELISLAKTFGKFSEEKLNKMSRKWLLAHVMDIYIDNAKNDLASAEVDKIKEIHAEKAQYITESQNLIPTIEKEVANITQSIRKEIGDNNITTLTPEDPKWTDYVLSLLQGSEIINGRPKYYGLKRIFSKVIGPILKTEIRVVAAPASENGGRATVECKIQYVNKHIIGENGNWAICSVSDAADCFNGNTEFPFSNYPTATASTMAEARCLRKALCINVIADEEAKGPNVELAKAIQEVQEQAQMATDIQKKTIANLSNKIGIDLSKFYAQEKKSEDTLSYSDAQSLINKLNLYQQGSQNKGEDPPEDILKD